MVCFSVIETQRKVQRSTQAAQRSTSVVKILVHNLHWNNCSTNVTDNT